MDSSYYVSCLPVRIFGLYEQGQAGLLFSKLKLSIPYFLKKVYISTENQQCIIFRTLRIIHSEINSILYNIV
jgi:hypothetical protein